MLGVGYNGYMEINQMETNSKAHQDEIESQGELAIIHEDNHIIVVIKPHNVPTQEDSSGDMDILNQIKTYVKESKGKEGEAFVGMVHRLDRVTGGAMVFAKTSKAASRLSEQMNGGEFSKRYLAVVTGTVKDRSGKLVNYLSKDEKTNVVKVVGQANVGAKRAELFYNIKTIGSAVSLVEVDLVTGRSHQIRVQLSNIGLPIVNDVKYGGRRQSTSCTSGRAYVALWAHELSFNHPISGDRMKFVVNPPENKVWDKFDFNRKKHKTK